MRPQEEEIDSEFIKSNREYSKCYCSRYFLKSEGVSDGNNRIYCSESCMKETMSRATQKQVRYLREGRVVEIINGEIVEIKD